MFGIQFARKRINTNQINLVFTKIISADQHRRKIHTNVKIGQNFISKTV